MICTKNNSGCLNFETAGVKIYNRGFYFRYSMLFGKRFLTLQGFYHQQ